MKPRIPARMLVLTALMTALTIVGAFIRVPTPWSAFTLTMPFVFLSGALLGPKYGAASQALYVLLGLMGLPVFSGGGGPMYVLQPTCGFLFSYIPAAALVGHILGRGPAPGYGRIVPAFLGGVCVIYAIGLPYMAAVLNLYLGRAMGAGEILMSGMVIFLPYDGVKVAVAAVAAKHLIPAVRKMDIV